MQAKNRPSNIVRSIPYQRSIIAANILLFVVSCIMLYQVRTTQPSAQTAQPQRPFAVTQKITQGQVSITVESVQFTQGKSVFTAPAGKQYVVITLQVTNTSDTPIQVLPTTQTYIKDASGNTYLVSPYALSAPFRAGELPPGESIRGELSYLVPAAGDLKLFIDAVWSGGVLPFAIKQ